MNPVTNDDLIRLIARIANADTQAFSTLYQTLEKPLYRFILTKLNDPFVAADILHDVFLEIWRGAARFQNKSSVKTWVFAIAYRKTMDVFRKNDRLVGEEEIPEQVDGSPDATQCLIAAEEKELVRNCLQTLKAEHRSVIEMTFFEDMSYREISEIAGIPEGTAKTRVFHAKSLLLRCLQARMGKGARQ
jgi:RNA polymerase sigma factor (sigma-70 family)